MRELRFGPSARNRANAGPSDAAFPHRGRDRRLEELLPGHRGEYIPIEVLPLLLNPQSDLERVKFVLEFVRWPPDFRSGPFWRRIHVMEARLKRLDVEAAKEDLKNRTLVKFDYDFARLIYLSSLRDLSTGEYSHHGLAHLFTESAAGAALAACHEELFYSLALGSLESFVAQLDRFIQSTHADYQRTLNAWETLEALNVTLPSVCDHMTAWLFRSNVKIAVALLKSPHSVQEEKSQPALPRRSLGR